MTETQTTTTETFIGPICGMRVESDTAAGSFKQDGETYYFCSTGCCLQEFISPTDEKPASCCCGN